MRVQRLAQCGRRRQRVIAFAPRGTFDANMRTFRDTLRGRVVLALPLAFPLAVLAAGCDKPAPATTDDAAANSASSASASAPPAASGSAATGGADADAGAPAKPTGKTVETPAGAASEAGDEIHLAGKTIYPPPECPAAGKDGCAKVKALRATMDGVKLLRHFDGPGGPKSILLFQVTTSGNTCTGGSLFFVRVAKDAPPQYSDIFDYCGGPDPMVGAMPDKILVNAPAHPATKGTGTVPAKNMEYDIATGALATAAPDTKKKKH
jgi:hypothetical protein